MLNRWKIDGFEPHQLAQSRGKLEEITQKMQTIQKNLHPSLEKPREEEHFMIRLKRFLHLS